MKLKDTEPLLGANNRHFTVVYEAFKFKDDGLLRDYIEFILNEPVEWIKGFPSKLRTRASFSKPKAALIKLLKTAPVQAHLGVDYCSKAHDVIWDTFKKHADTILDGREKSDVVVEDTNTLVQESAPLPNENELEEVATIPEDTNTPAQLPVSVWERKYRILQSVVMSMLHDYRENTGLVMGIHTLLANLEHDASSS
jgi:hypothetical protein